MHAEWFRVVLDGATALLVHGWPEANAERRRLRAQHPGAQVWIERA